MVCEDCKSKLSVISAPDPWAAGSRGATATRRVNENKLLRKGVRSNPYGNGCKICKLKCQQNNAMYCTICAYAKGICSICGKQVLLMNSVFRNCCDVAIAVHGRCWILRCTKCRKVAILTQYIPSLHT